MTVSLNSYQRSFQAPWTQVNLELIAKSIAELSFEEIFTLKKRHNDYILNLQSGVSYTFQGTMGIWGYISINPQSIKRNPEIQNNFLSSAQFFIDSKIEHGMDDIILANFLEEMNNTLAQDLVLYQKKIPVLEAIHLSDENLQTILNGHPKILLNKGRVGWSASDNEKYSPESSKGFRLLWLAVKKHDCTAHFNLNYKIEYLLKDAMDEQEFTRFQNLLNQKNIEQTQYHFIPMHPWQYQRFIKTQFIHEFQNGTFIYLGEFGDLYKPQISLRTLTNITRPGHLDIKLPLTILNTSAIRGLTEKYLKIGPNISNYIEDICNNDPLLNSLNTSVLKEVAGISYTGEHFRKIKNAPYRYHEFLGATWRESSNQKNAFMSGVFFYVDQNNDSLIGEFIKKSGLTPDVWLKQYFRHVVIPFYHLQLKYGLALVAHGQNTVVKFKDFIPQGLYLKDFGGDLRISSEKISLHKNIEAIKDLNTLPEHYLIHDLITGHFVTVLRYISAIMRDCEHFSENNFYRILGEVISDYYRDYHQKLDCEIPKELNLLNPKIHRVLVNAVRFKIGYADSSERPKPILGTDIDNPIYIGLKHKSTQELHYENI